MLTAKGETRHRPQPRADQGGSSTGAVALAQDVAYTTLGGVPDRMAA